MILPGARGVLVDAAGTLLHPREPVARTYRRFAAGFGAVPSEPEVAAGVREAMGRHRDARDGDPRWMRFWGLVVEESTGCSDPELLRQLYEHYGRADAWRVVRGAEVLCQTLRGRGVALGLVSNWDTRLRPLLEGLGIFDWFDTVVVSAEEGIEKPNARIFELACKRIGVEPADALMVGDSTSKDVAGARAAGLAAIHFGADIPDFEALLRHRMLREHVGDDVGRV